MSSYFSSKFSSISQGSARSTPRRIPSLNTVKNTPVLMKERYVAAGKYHSTVVDYYEDDRYNCPGLVYKLRPILPDGSVSSTVILARNLYFENYPSYNDLIETLNRYGFGNIEWQSLETMEEEFRIEYIPSSEYAVIKDRVYLGGGPGNHGNSRIPVSPSHSGGPGGITVSPAMSVDTDMNTQDELPFEI